MWWSVLKFPSMTLAANPGHQHNGFFCMARSRNIKPGFFKNEILGEADPIYSLLFAGLWTIADKEGRLENRPKRIKAEIFPYRFDLDVCLALDWLKHESFITMYEVDQNSYIEINNWRKHQSPHHKEVASVIPSISDQNKPEEPEVKQQVPQAQAKHDSSMDQDQAKEDASCPTDSLNLIPDSLNIDSLNIDLEEQPPVDKSPAKPRKKTKTKLPTDFLLTHSLSDMAFNYWSSKNRSDLDPQEEFNNFTNHHRARGSTMACWESAWKTWYGNAVKFSKPPQQVRSSVTEGNQAAALAFLRNNK